MSKDDVMSAPKSRKDVLGALRSQAAAIEGTPPADNVQPMPKREPQAADESRAVVEHRAQMPGGLDLNAIRAMKPRKEARDQAVGRYPVSILEDLDLICRLTGMVKNDVMIDALRKEVATLKKRMGLE